MALYSVSEIPVAIFLPLLQEPQMGYVGYKGVDKGVADDPVIRMYTVCLVQDGNKVPLLNRPSGLGFPGYVGPGGKVDFPESLSECAIREVWEETGLHVKDLVYKGLDEYIDATNHFRGMVFNYLTSCFEGELLENPPEGEPNRLGSG